MKKFDSPRIERRRDPDRATSLFAGNGGGIHRPERNSKPRMTLLQHIRNQVYQIFDRSVFFSANGEHLTKCMGMPPAQNETLNKIINKGHIVAEDSPENLRARLAGAEHVVLRVRGDAEELAPTISKIRGVKHVKAQPDGTLEFQFAPENDIRPEVAKATIGAGFDLLEMRPVGLSLEEIFLQLTQNNTQEK